MYKNQIVFHNHENGMKVAKMLLEENNVVMLSYEEDLLVLNWEWTPSAQPDRNYVVFMSRDEYEEEQDEIAEEIREHCKEDAQRVISEAREEYNKFYEEETPCDNCIYQDDEVEDPICETCKYRYPNNYISK